jgi:hypothetical protein
MMNRSVGKLLVVPLAGLALLAGACGSDDSSSSSDTTAASTTTEASSSSATVQTSEIQIAQTELDEVGCWAGAIDGVEGPQTEAAIEAFQKAEGLTVDGKLGEQTLTALSTAAAAGKRVCAEPAGTTTTTAPANACVEVTEAEVQAAVSSDVTVDKWYCALDGSGKAWVGGFGEAGSEKISVNYILEPSASGGLTNYADMAACTNPPIPASLLTWCQTS